MAELIKAPWSDWETVRLIGRGSFGTVYEIQRKLVDGETEAAALKVITIPQNPSDIDELYSEGYDEESITATFNAHLKSIIAEYSLMRKMEGSANVVNCNDIRYIQHDSGLGWDIYIRMELLTPLLKALPAQISEADVIKVGKDICGALILCKKHGIIHRDIKPQNIFMSPNGDYKLGDFGIAKTVEKTMGGTKIGTYKYMAPEVYNNQPYGSAADIYSLGLVLYWMLNQRRMPFMPMPPAKLTAAQDEEARYRRLSGQKIPEPAQGCAALKQIVLKACAYDPKDRFASAADMLEALNGLGGVAAVIPAAVICEENGAEDKTNILPDENTQLCPEEGTAVLLPEEGTAILPPEELTQLCPEEKTAVMAAPASGAAYTEAAAQAAAQRAAQEQKKKNEQQWDIYLYEEQEAEERKRKIKTVFLCLLPLAALLLVMLLLRSCMHEGPAPTGVGNAQVIPEKPWSEWTDALPAQVSSDKYYIEEKTLYSSSTLETITSDDKNELPNWELYDTVEAGVGYGSWSEWSTKKATASDTREVEKQTRYRYRDKETTTSTSSKKSGWTKYDTTYTTGDFGAWSDWSTSSVKSSDNRQVETKTQYRYRSISKSTEYTAWSSWSSWSGTRQSTSDLKKEESRTVWGYYYFLCPGCGAHMHGWGITCPTWAGGCGKTYIPESGWREVYSTIPWNNAGLKDWHGTGKYYTDIDGQLVFRWTSHGTSTQYRYATRSTKQVTTYGNWSGWGDTVYTASSSREVQSRTVYRYRERSQAATYYFYRWGDWSDWLEDSVSGNADRQVETKTFYRYRDQLMTTTYYFRRWSEWSSYSETPVTATDTRQVKTVTQYRYKEK